MMEKIEEMSNQGNAKLSDDVSSGLKRKGLVHFYTGNGKGKTTAALGLALRSAGHGHNVHIIQFLKGGYYTGELIAAETILKKSGRFDIKQFGKGCIKTDKQTKLMSANMHDECPRNFNVRDDVSCGQCRQCFLTDKEESDQIKQAIEHTKEVLQSDDIDVVVLDEISHVVNKNMFSLPELMMLIDSRKPHIELILTGRDAPRELLNRADLVTEMKEIKHPFRKGIEGRKGIEY
ncbi:MAG: cob(I)yrinic acid a,c-diamide adenosyltransferase [Nanoarchaeota archaeon]|nr:cob(I)yrinic acid a,c-diamide adenosyltransferase [Nanoarchaeota archaeon]